MIGTLGVHYDLSLSVSRPHLGGFMMNFFDRQVVERRLQERLSGEGFK